MGRPKSGAVVAASDAAAAGSVSPLVAPACHVPLRRPCLCITPPLVPPVPAVFDTAALTEGHVYQLDAHLQRFLTSAAKANIGLPRGMSVEQMRRTILETAAASLKLNGALGSGLPARVCAGRGRKHRRGWVGRQRCRHDGPTAFGRVGWDHCTLWRAPTPIPCTLVTPSPAFPRARSHPVLAVCWARRLWAERQRVPGPRLLLHGLHPRGP